MTETSLLQSGKDCSKTGDEGAGTNKVFEEDRSGTKRKRLGQLGGSKSLLTRIVVISRKLILSVDRDGRDAESDDKFVMWTLLVRLHSGSRSGRAGEVTAAVEDAR